MERHLNILGVLYIVFGAIGLLIAAFFYVGFMTGKLAESDFNAFEITAVMATAVTLVMVLISIPQIIAGIGLLQRHSWALILANILSFINLFSFPLGTIVGIYSIWVLAKPEARALLSPAHARL